MRRRLHIRKFFLIPAILLFQIGCPVTCVIHPTERDYLTTERSVTIDGVLGDYDIASDVTRPLPFTFMPCGVTWYRENLPDYDRLGSSPILYPGCADGVESDSTGIFSTDLYLPSDPGLYHFEFDIPCVLGVCRYDSERLITLRPDLVPAPDQYVYLDWETHASNFINAFNEVFTATLRPDVLRGMDPLLLTEVETERMLESHYDGMRVYIRSSPSDTDTQTVTMDGYVNGVAVNRICGLDLPALGGSEIDYLNQSPNNTSFVYVGSLARAFEVVSRVVENYLA